MKCLRCLLVSFEVAPLPVCHVFCHHSLYHQYHCNQFRFQGCLCVLKEIECNACLGSHSRTFAQTLRRILTAHKTLHGCDKSKLINSGVGENNGGLFTTEDIKSHVELKSPGNLHLTLRFSQHDREFFCPLQYFVWH